MVVALGFISTGCQDFLNTEPASSWDAENFYKDATEADLALAGIYGTLASDNIYGQALPIIMESGTDEGYYNRRYNENWTVGLYRHTASDNYVKNLWLQFYTAINRINLFISKLNKEAFTTEEYDRYVAEARFLRGLSYFTLAEWYGDVPLVLDPTVDQSSNDVAPTAQVEVFEQSILDLEYAAEKLYHSSDPNYVAGRANSMAAHGLLARVYMKMAGEPLLQTEKYQNAKEECEIIINDGWHQLAVDGDSLAYKNLFLSYIQNSYEPRESMFEISFALMRDQGLSVHGRIGAINGVAFAYGGGVDGYPGSYNMYSVAPSLSTVYSSGDSRADWNLPSMEYNGNGDIKRVTSKLSQKYNPGKFRRWEPSDYADLDVTPASGVLESYILLENVTSPTKNFTCINLPIIRYADVLLMYAEASNEVEGAPTAEAIAALNQVRNRALIGNIEIENPNAIVSKESFFNEIVDERLRELCFEGLRKQDLIRWGLLGEKLDYTNMLVKGESDYKASNEDHNAFLRPGNNFDETKHLTLPYPLQEVMINNSLDQKAGW